LACHAGSAAEAEAARYAQTSSNAPAEHYSQTAFHADAPNDAPAGGYNAAAPVAGLPASPLAVEGGAGFS